MVTVARQMIPAGQEAGVPCREPRAFRLAPAEVRRAGQEPVELGLAPEERPHVEAARRSAVEQLEEGAARPRECEVTLDEGNRHPDARARRLDGRGDASKGRLAVDERPDCVPVPERVAAALRGGNPLDHRACSCSESPNPAHTMTEIARGGGPRAPRRVLLAYCETTAEMSAAVSLMSRADVLPALESMR